MNFFSRSTLFPLFVSLSATPLISATPQALAFGAEVLVPGSQGLGSAVADFDGDGRVDYVYGHVLNGHSQLRVVRGTVPDVREILWSECILCATNAPAPVVAAGDLDGDGDIDLVHSEGFDVIALRMNDGGGGFAARTELSQTFLAVRWIEVHDVDADGALDLIVGSSLNGNPNDRIAIVRNLGGAVFAAPEWLPSPLRAPRASVVDLDGDGRAELVLADREGERLVVVQRAPTGVLSAVATHPLGARVVDVAAGDFDGDGHTDFVFAAAEADTVVVVRNLGAFVFATSATIQVLGRPSRLLTSDLDGDGLLDLAVATEDSDALTVLRGNGNGTFDELQNVAIGFDPTTLNAVDHDADGDTDLLIGHWRGGAQRLLRNRGDGTFAASGEVRLAVGAAREPRSVATGDLDADGQPEVVALDRAHGDLVVFPNLGARTFGPLEVTTTATLAGRHTLVDVDGDGHLDVVIAGRNTGGALALFGRGNRTFEPPIVIPFGVDTEHLAVVDLDGDTRLDVVVTVQRQVGGTLWHDYLVALQPASRSFQTLPAVTTGGFVKSFTAADIDGDGTVDLGLDVSDSGASQHRWFSLNTGRGDGTFLAAPPRRTPFSGLSVIVHDLDGDGLAELVSPVWSSIWVQRSLGGGNFDLGERVRLPSNTVEALGVDVDGGGRHDLLVTSDEGVLTVLRVDALGRFEAPVQIGFGVRPRGVSAADLDGDGLPDLVGYDTYLEQVLVRFNGVR